MLHTIIIAVAIACVAGLFALEADPGERTSWALWLPLFWCFIIGTKPISEWIHGQSAKNLERYAEGTPLDAAIFGLVILVALLVLNYRSGQVRRFIQFNPALMMFLFYCAASILWSDFPLVSFKRWIKEMGDVVIVLVVLTDPQPLAAIKRVFARLSFVFVLFSIVFILFIPSMGTEQDTVTGVIYYNGMMTQKNQLGQSCMVAGLGCLWLLLNAIEAPRSLRRRKLLLLYGTTFAGAVWLIAKANSVTSLSCMAEASVVMILITRPWVRQRASRVLAVACGAVGFAIFAVFLDTAGGLLHSVGRSSTLTGRTDIWRAVLSAHANPIFGTGYESFWLGKRLEYVWDVTGQHGILQSHNGYIEIYVNLGWVGLLLLGWVIVAGFRSATIAFYRDPRAGRLGLAFLTAALIYNVSEAGFRMMTLIWFAFLLAATGIPAGAQSRPVAKAVRRRGFRFAPGGRTRILQ